MSKQNIESINSDFKLVIIFLLAFLVVVSFVGYAI